MDRWGSTDNTEEKRNERWKYLYAVTGEILKANPSLTKKKKKYKQTDVGQRAPCRIQNSSSWVSRSGISVWNLQSPSYNFFIYSLISVSAHERPLRKCYFQWIMLSCLAEALPRWSSLLQNIALSHWHSGGPVQFLSVAIALAKTLLFLMQELSPLHLIKNLPYSVR